MDTTTVNYAINKLSTAFTIIQPKLQGLTDQFIKYTVTSEILNFIVAILFTIICSIICYIFTTKSIKDGWYSVQLVLPAILSGVVGEILLISIIFEIPNIILAINYPEMFTIQKIIK